MVIAFDYDGTVTEDGSYPGAGALDPCAVEALRRIKELGHRLILFTCREGEALKVALSALQAAGISVDAVNAQVPGLEAFGRKPYADLYVDDRSWPQIEKRHIDWEQLLAWLETAAP